MASGDSFNDINLKIYELLFVLIASLSKMTNGRALHSLLLLILKLHILVNTICKHLTFSNLSNILSDRWLHSHWKFYSFSSRRKPEDFMRLWKPPATPVPHFQGGLLLSLIWGQMLDERSVCTVVVTLFNRLSHTALSILSLRRRKAEGFVILCTGAFSFLLDFWSWEV